jgi:hypothetical protein
MAKETSDEIDTMFEAEEGKIAANAADQVKSISADIAIGGMLESSKSELSETAILPEKIFYFPAFPRRVYCTVDNIRVRLLQTGEGRGIAYLTFTQTCGSRRSTVAKGADWSFTLNLYDVRNAFIRSIFLGTWDHRCGKHLVELRADFGWVVGSINPVINADHAVLNWTALQRVHNCG